MSKQTEALKLALVALMRSRKAVSGDLDLAGCAYGKNDPDGHRYDDAKEALVTLDKAITALREALAEQPAQQVLTPWSKALEDVWAEPDEVSLPAQQKPAFHGFMDEERCCVNICYTPWAPGGPNNELPTAYYTSPPAQRKPLTDAQINAFFEGTEPNNGFWLSFARAIEAAHGIKEKNT